MLAACGLLAACVPASSQPTGSGPLDVQSVDGRGPAASDRTVSGAPGPGARQPFAKDAASEALSADVTHVVWRTAALTALAILSVLALGTWIGIGERSYLYLSLALLAQVVFMASSGGELARVPWLGPLIGNDPRTPPVAALSALLAGFVFMTCYLDMKARHARAAAILRGCMIALWMLLGLTLLTGAADVLMLVTKGVVTVGTLAVLAASMRGVLEGQRAAGFLLLSWVPLLGILGLRAGEVLGVWTLASWVEQLVHAGPALSGLLLTIGLTDTLQQLRRDRDQASHMATYDALTGALARPVIEERLHTLVAKAHASGRPLSLVFFDIDRFKMVNDSHGHQVGDSCLRIIALRTRNRLRTYDVVGRWGGDELLVILPDTRLGEALGVAENLRSAVNCRSLSVDGKLFDASLSLGVAELAAGETAEHLLERADAALYASKSAGRDRVTGQAHPRFVDPEPGMRRGLPDRRMQGKPDSEGSK